MLCILTIVISCTGKSVGREKLVSKLVLEFSQGILETSFQVAEPETCIPEKFLNKPILKTSLNYLILEIFTLIFSKLLTCNFSFKDFQRGRSSKIFSSHWMQLALDVSRESIQYH